MSECYSCHRLPATSRCLACEHDFCLNCSGAHHQHHLFDDLEKRLTERIEKIPVEFNEVLDQQYQDANTHLRLWFEELRHELNRSFEMEIEGFLKSEVEDLRLKTNDYIREQIQHYTNLRSNVVYTKERLNEDNGDHEIDRLISIENKLLEEFKQYFLQFRLKTMPIDIKNYFRIEKEFVESIDQTYSNSNYSWSPTNQTLILRSTIQQITASGLDLFVFVVEKAPNYPRLLEFSASLLSSNLSLTHSIDFPYGTNIDDMCWSTEFNCLFLLSAFYLHTYDKFNRKVIGKVLELSNLDNKWKRVTTNRYGVSILNQNSSIELYTDELSRKFVFKMKQLIDGILFVYDVRGRSEFLCTLALTNTNRWKIDLFQSQQLEHQRSFTLTETLERPLKLLNGCRRNTWFIVDGDNHRIIIFDKTMDNIEYFPFFLTTCAVTVLDDQTLVVVSPESSGTKISFFYANRNNSLIRMN